MYILEEKYIEFHIHDKNLSFLFITYQNITFIYTFVVTYMIAYMYDDVQGLPILNPQELEIQKRKIWQGLNNFCTKVFFIMI